MFLSFSIQKGRLLFSSPPEATPPSSPPFDQRPAHSNSGVGAAGSGAAGGTSRGAAAAGAAATGAAIGAAAATGAAAAAGAARGSRRSSSGRARPGRGATRRRCARAGNEWEGGGLQCFSRCWCGSPATNSAASKSTNMCSCYLHINMHTARRVFCVYVCSYLIPTPHFILHLWSHHFILHRQSHLEAVLISQSPMSEFPLSL